MHKHKAIVIVYSARGVFRPSGIRRFGIGHWSESCVFWCLVFWVNTLFCVYISALSGGTSVCRVIILLELSKLPLIELVARSVRIQLALRALFSLVGRRFRLQLGIAFRHSPADEHLFVVVASSRCPPSR